MIDAKELRSGNWLKTEPLSIPRMGIFSNGYTQITAYGIAMIEEHKVADRYEPIELTPDILLKCGFEDSMEIRGFEQHIRYKLEYFTAGFTNDICEVWYRNIQFKLTSLHKLQNIYFALTGTELTFNQQ